MIHWDEPAPLGCVWVTRWKDDAQRERLAHSMYRFSQMFPSKDGAHGCHTRQETWVSMQLGAAKKTVEPDDCRWRAFPGRKLALS